MIDLTRYVDMTFGTADGSCCSIGPNRPNASVLPAPDTFPRSYSTGYIPDKPIRGFSQTHMSAGAQKYGNFLVSPQIGLMTASDSHDSEKENENPTAAEYGVTLKRYGIDVSFTPAEHSVIYKFRYPKSDDASIVLDAAYNICRYTYRVKDLCVNIGTDEKGYTVIYGSGNFDADTSFAPYYQYFYAVTDKKPREIGTFVGSEISSETLSLGQVEFDSEESPYASGMGAYVRFDTEQNEEIYLKIGISFKSVEKAKEWLYAEIPEWDYNAVKNETVRLWNEELGKIEIDGENITDYQKIRFYTMLYKSHINPRDRTGDLEKFGDADFIDDHLTVWDTFRSLYPLYTITNPDFVAKTVNSFIARFKVNGCVRDHSHAGYERLLGQGGDDVDNVIAEAYLKGIEGVDWKKAYEVVKDNAENWRNDQNVWSPEGGLPSAYRDIGYIPGDEGKRQMCCSRSLEYYYNDYLAAQMAKGLGYTEDYEKYIKRSKNWKKIWNPEIESDGFKGYIWPKTADGEWVEDDEYLPSASFRCKSWLPYFYEGTAFEYAFFVPHDVEGLIEKMGGEALFNRRIEVGIKENYIAISNQPAMLQSFLPNHTSEPWRTTDMVDLQLAKYRENGTPGCDDSGCFCSWYIFAIVGIFPNGGQDFYYLTSPKYEQTTFNLENGKTFTVKANNLSETNKYIQAVYLNGTQLASTTINHSDIMSGGTLVYEMGRTPVDYSAVETASGSVAEGNYEWSLNSKGVLTISGTGDGTLRFDKDITAENVSDIPWYSVREDVLKVVIAEGTGITKAAAYSLSNLPNCREIVLASTLTDLSCDRIFAANTALTTVYAHNQEKEQGVINLTDMTALGNSIFEDSSAGLTVLLRLGECEFAPVTWFTNTTTVNFYIQGRSNAETWINNVKNGTTDTGSDDYKFIIGAVDTVVSGEETANNIYSWILDTETGVLTFINLTTEWNELSFTATETAFCEWVLDWKDEIEHIVIPYFDKLTINNSTPFEKLTNLKTVKCDTGRWQTPWSIVFFGCKSLTSLGNSSNFEEGKIKLDGYRVENLYGSAPALFAGCISITDVDFTGFMTYKDDKVSQNVTIGSNMLKGCTSLKAVNLTGVTEIKANAIGGCTSLTEVTIPTSVTAIASDAFSGCTALTIVTLMAEEYTDGLLTATSFPDTEALTIYCQNQDVANAVNALGYTLTKAVNANVTVESGIKVEGFSIRTEGYNGLRGIFSFDNSAIATNKASGFTLVEYGAILASEANKNAYGTELTFSNSPKTLAISTDRKTLKNGFADLRGITSISTQAFSSTLISSVYFDDAITSLELNAFNTAQTLTLYTGVANNAAVASFAADNTYRTYIGGKSFIDASGITVLKQ